MCSQTGVWEQGTTKAVVLPVVVSVTAYASFGDVFVYFLVPKLLLGYPYP